MPRSGAVRAAVRGTPGEGFRTGRGSPLPCGRGAAFYIRGNPMSVFTHVDFDQHEQVVSRFDKLKRNYESVVAMACAFLWLPM